MLQLRRHPDLALKPLGAERCRELGVQHLERDGALVLESCARYTVGHTAATELTLDDVRPASAAGERVAVDHPG